MVDQRIYLPGSARWLQQQADLADWEAAWVEAHREAVDRARRPVQPMRGRGAAWGLHFTVLSFPSAYGEWAELLIDSRCPGCLRSWPMPRDFQLGAIEVVVQSGESLRAEVSVTCRACLSEHDAQFTHL